MERDKLASGVKLLLLALLREQEAVMPVLKGIKFDGLNATAANDVIMMTISLPKAFGVDGIVPGRPLSQFLSASTGKKVSIAKAAKGKKAVVVRAGSSRLTLPLSPLKDWPFDLPDVEGVERRLTARVGEPFFSALQLCSAQLQDRGLGSWLGGLALRFEKGRIGMYGLDGSRKAMSVQILDGFKCRGYKYIKEALVPANFCRAAVAMYKELAGINSDVRFYVTGDAVLLVWGGGVGTLFSKLISVEHPDVVAAASRIADQVERFTPINAGFAAALRRAAAIGEEALCSVSSSDSGLVLRARSSDAVRFQETVTFKRKPVLEQGCTLTADLVAKRLDDCNEFAIGKEAIVLRNKDTGYSYFVANHID